jgi:N-acetylmuramoyl-L-alanine amidase
MMVSLFVCVPAQAKDFTVVIDAGHGGHDPGAIGKKGKEKSINLNVALKLGELIRKGCDDVHIVYTRKTDVFIPLDRRAQIANNAKADLFISIHTNSVAKGNTARGTETYTLGLHRTEENLEVAKKENSVILIEDNYEQRYAGFNPNSSESYIMFEFLQDKNMEKSVQLATLVQRQFKSTAKRIDKGVHQAGFLVLRATSMPSVLIELGYISTPDEESYLLSEAGSSALAESIYKAFVAYKKTAKSGQTGAKVKATEPETPEPEAMEAPATDMVPTADQQEEAPRTAQEQPRKTAGSAKGSGTAKATGSAAKGSGSSAAKGKPVFKIQILTSSTELPKGSKKLKGLIPVSYYKEGGIYKYTYGESTDYNKILRTKREITAKFKDCFIIAFKDGKKTDVNAAIKEFKNSK